MNKIFCFFITLFLASKIHAQQTTTIFQHATIHLGNGQVIENGVMVCEQGNIAYVGTQLNALYKNATYIDATGKHIYPGFLCLQSVLGLNEIDAVRATRDYQETGLINPNVRSLIAYNTDSKLLPTALFNGILYVQPVPQGGLISGSSSVVKTRAWNWEDASEKADVGVHINWPEWGMFGNSDAQANRQQLIQSLHSFINQSLAYCHNTSPQQINLRMEAMRPVYQKKSKLYIHVSTAKGMLEAMHFFEQSRSASPQSDSTLKSVVDIVWVGAEESYLILDEIKRFGSPVILNMTHRLPGNNHEDIDMPFKLPFLLTQYGITVALANSGSWESRNLVFNAGTAASYGLSKEQALMLITYNAALVTGTQERIGSLEAGKKASFIICTGDLLDMRTHHIQQAFIDGLEVELNGEQQVLYKKYMQKFGLGE